MDIRAWLARHESIAAERDRRTAARLRTMPWSYEAHAYDRSAMRHDARALRFGTPVYVAEVPPPTNAGARAMDEALYGVPEWAKTTCVICGTEILRAKRGDAVGATGLYCSACE